MKINSIAAATVAVLSLIYAQEAWARGRSITTECKTLSETKRDLIEFSIVRSVNHNTRKGLVSVDFKGQIHWDAEPHTAHGSFSADLPLGPGAVPSVPKTYSVTKNSNSISVQNNHNEQTKMPSPIQQTTIKVKVDDGLLGMGAQWAVLKLISPDVSEGIYSAFGYLYISNQSETQVTYADKGPLVSLVCSSQINDL